MVLVIGLLIGASLGLTGAGGAVFAVPLLMILLSMPIGEAIGLALGAVAMGAGLGAFLYWRQGQMLWLPALSFAGGGLVTAPLGKWLGHQLPEFFLLMGFSLLALGIAYRQWLVSNKQSVQGLIPSADVARKQSLNCRFSDSGQLELKPRCLSVMLFGGLAVGLLAGLFGVGGGFLIIPLIIYQTGVAMPLAVGASLFSVMVISSSAFATYLLSAGNLSLVLLAKMAAGIAVGIFAGIQLSKHINHRHLQQGFVFALVAVVAITWVDFSSQL